MVVLRYNSALGILLYYCWIIIYVPSCVPTRIIIILLSLPTYVFCVGNAIGTIITPLMCATCLVSDPPVGQPVLSLEKRHYTIGDTLKGNCTSPPSSPPSNVTWYLNDKWVCWPNLTHINWCRENIITCYYSW